MVVVGTDSDPWFLHSISRSRGWEIRHDVARSLLYANDSGREAHPSVQGESRNVWVACVEVSLDICQRPRVLRVLEEHRRDVAGHAGGRDPRPGNRGVKGHRYELAGVRGTRSSDHEHRFCPTLPGSVRLVSKVR